ncbi:MAG: fused MFS/spermidine synthase [Planctomycetota bacterium]|jgi:predicted membrane-bound spermidine synthase
MGWLFLVFFVSGFPALVYQIVWQGSLFTIYGVNSESITVVVSAFLLGLGLGSLLGGWLSRRSKLPLLVLFGVVELGIGLFGFFSLPLFKAVGHATLGASTTQTFVLSFGLVVIPTLLMGATLPILTEYLVRRYRNVGRSVGNLYAVNTFGSAVACFVAALFLLGWLGKAGTVAFAGSLNLLVGAGAVLIHLRGAAGEERPVPAPGAEGVGERPQMLGFRFALLLAFLTGFIALSYEIVWARIYNFVSEGRATAFPLFLGAFLFGIAGGSLVARRYCAGGLRHLVALAHFVLLANAAGFLLAPVLVWAGPVLWFWTGTLPLVALAAALLGATFPLLCHAAIPPQDSAGARLSYMYVANIVGSVAGGLLTGFFLLDVFSLGTIAVVLSLLGLGLGGALFMAAGLRGRPLAVRVAVTAGMAIVVVALAGPVFGNAYFRLQFKSKPPAGGTLTHIVENKSGVITVDSDKRIYGGGAYDGAYNIDPTGDDINAVYRAYALSGFHAAPRKVLVVGMSSGSWANVIAQHPQLERLVIVEINPGYVELLDEFDEVRSLQANPKVEIIVDDGRRWLVANPDARFDVIVSNTTFAWRAHASNLLSMEFFELCRAHMNEGAVLYYNTTGSRETQHTGAFAFPHASRYGTMMVVSDAPLDWNPERWRKTLRGYRLDGKTVFDPANPAHMRKIEDLLAQLDRHGPPAQDTIFRTFETREAILSRTADCVPITDDNMGIEFTTLPPAPFPIRKSR